MARVLKVSPKQVIVHVSESEVRDWLEEVERGQGFRRDRLGRGRSGVTMRLGRHQEWHGTRPPSVPSREIDALAAAIRGAGTGKTAQVKVLKLPGLAYGRAVARARRR